MAWVSPKYVLKHTSKRGKILTDLKKNADMLVFQRSWDAIKKSRATTEWDMRAAVRDVIDEIANAVFLSGGRADSRSLWVTNTENLVIAFSAVDTKSLLGTVIPKRNKRKFEQAIGRVVKRTKMMDRGATFDEIRAPTPPMSAQERAEEEEEISRAIAMSLEPSAPAPEHEEEDVAPAAAMSLEPEEREPTEEEIARRYEEETERDVRAYEADLEAMKEGEKEEEEVTCTICEQTAKDLGEPELYPMLGGNSGCTHIVCTRCLVQLVCDSPLCSFKQTR